MYKDQRRKLVLYRKNCRNSTPIDLSIQVSLPDERFVRAFGVLFELPNLYVYFQKQRSSLNATFYNVNKLHVIM